MGKRFELAYPYLRVFGRTAASLEAIKEAGFAGVEIHLVNYRNRRRANDLARDIKHAESLRLTVTVHQAWSLSDSPQHLFNWPLALFGYLPINSNDLKKHLGETKRYPVVVYADLMRQATQLSEPTLFLQTFSIAKNGEFTTPYFNFVRTSKRLCLPVVFDTQHVIEHKLGRRGVTNFPQNQEELLLHLREAWFDLGEQTAEIHLVDSQISGDTMGRNVPLGQGVLPLKEFAKLVIESGWQGRIVPEISPKISQLFESYTKQVARLVKVRKQVEDLFQML